ncbi:hypothetical protein Lal_00012749 [Lupinus albus]|nr:hypothetical protein Lal_00012749 [Lupinus albus]
MDIESGEIQQACQAAESSQDSASPFYLHPGENLRHILVSPRLDGTSYHSWSRSMKRALLSKNKFNFVNGKITIPQDSDPTFNA